MEQNKDINGIMNNLEDIVKSYDANHGVIDYVKMAEYTNQLLDIVFEGEEYTLPVDINKVVEYLEIEVSEIDLNDENNKNRSNRVVGELSVRPHLFEDGEKRCIYIDSNTTLHTQRYALAHEIGHYLINKRKKLFSDSYCIMPMLPKEAKELVADAFAIFLLIPIKVFIKEFDNYIEENRKNRSLPISTEDWLQYLSTVANVSYHYVACGYQHLRCVSHWLYQYRYEKMKLDKMEKLDIERDFGVKELQIEVNRKMEECSLLTQDIEEYLTEDIVNRLFQ